MRSLSNHNRREAERANLVEIGKNAKKFANDVTLDAIDDELPVTSGVRALAQALVHRRWSARQRFLWEFRMTHDVTWVN